MYRIRQVSRTWGRAVEDLAAGALLFQDDGGPYADGIGLRLFATCCGTVITFFPDVDLQLEHFNTKLYIASCLT